MTINWTIVGQYVQQGVAALTTGLAVAAPIIDLAAPEAAPALTIIAAVLKDASAAAPAALTLVQQFQGGTAPTPAQLQTIVLTYNADDDALNADIAAHITALQPKA